MALSAYTDWSVRADGDDSNGGGFFNGVGAGTNRSLTAAAFVTLTTAAVVNATTTKIDVPSGEHTVSAADVGNIIQISGGTATAGFYEITGFSVDGGVNQWFLDRSAGTAGQTAPCKMGGALATIPAALTPAIAGNTIWVKAGTYTRTATLTITEGAYYEIGSTRPLKIIGYNTTQGDNPTGNNRPVISLSTNTGLTGIVWTSTPAWIENIIVDCNGLGTSQGFEIGEFSTIINCAAREFTTYGFRTTAGSVLLWGCEASSGSGTAGFLTAAENTLVFCWAHDNTCTGFQASGAGVCYLWCIASNNSGGTSPGFLSSYGVSFTNCIAYGNGQHGIFINQPYVIREVIHNCILYGNGGYGLSWSTTGLPRVPALRTINFNAFRNNTSGKYPTTAYGDTTGNNGTGALTLSDVDLTADPFVDAANNDFRLNSTAGGGAALRAAGIPGQHPGIVLTGYIDIGALQHQDAGGGGMLVHPGMSGGMRG